MGPQPVPCPPPTRTRAPDQLVELFLHSWQEARFTSGITWPPRRRRNVTVLARDPAGERLALLRVPVRADDSLEERLGPLAAALAADSRLDCPDREFHLRFLPGFLAKALGQHGDRTSQALLAWATATLPSLAPGSVRQFTIPLSLSSGKSGRVRVEVTVAGREAGTPSVSVGGYPVSDRELLGPLVRRALAAQLPVLAGAAADRRVLLFDVDAAWPVLNLVRELADRFPLLAQVSHLVAADASGCGPTFRVWDLFRDELGAVLQPVVSTPPALTPAGPLASLARQAEEFAKGAKAENTLRAYASDWEHFRRWCEKLAIAPLPADPRMLAMYLTDCAATGKASSIERRLTTINRAHEAAGLTSPANMRNAVVSEVWKGIRRRIGTAGEGKKPLLTVDLRKILAALPPDLQGTRDRALLLTGFAGGFRRSELARLRREDLKETAEGVVAILRRSKTDPEGQGRPVALPFGSDPLTCPVRALRTWIDQAGITSGPLFRGVDQFGLISESALCPDSVAWIVKRAARRAGLNAAEYAGHSLRAGLATQAAMNGASELAIMKQTGHRSLPTVRRYIRDGTLFRDNAATKLGL